EYLDSIPANYPELAEAIERGAKPEEHEIDHFQRDLFLFPSIIKTQILDSDGSILWEMERSGPQYEESSWASPVKDSKDEILIQILEPKTDTGPGLSVFYPYVVDDQLTAYIKIIDADQQVHRNLKHIRRMVISLVALSGLVFYVLLFILFYRSYVSLRRSNRRLEKTQAVTIRTMSRLAELRDTDTGAHIDRTSLYCEVLARELMKKKQYSGYISHKYVEDLKRSAPLHDIGKVGIPDSILNKPGPLTDEDWILMKRHPKLGAQILKKAVEELDFQSYFEIGLQVALCHHENWDGTGYPEGLSGERIPLSSRIMALADVYDALRTHRPYKAPMSHETAMNIILDDRGKKFDPGIVDAFAQVHEKFREISKIT
ncbi:MAG: HD domain-containing protein, partial [Spirochaetaceae bacterium]|nr:HD domain-containing protein [Spirochaetaceae bacterium]